MSCADIGRLGIADLLRRHVIRRTEELARRCDLVLLGNLARNLGKTEIENLHNGPDSPRRYHQVARLDVAMDHAQLKRVLKCPRRLPNNVTGVCHTQRAMCFHNSG